MTLGLAPFSDDFKPELVRHTMIASVKAKSFLSASRLSEANLAVMQKVRDVREALSADEQSAAVTFVNNADVAALQSADKAWQMLAARLASGRIAQ